MEYTGGIFKTGLNLTAESLRYKYNIGTDMVILNMCVYVLEMILLFLSVITVLLLYGTAFYLYVARGNVYEETPQTTLLYVSYVMTASNLIGFASLAVSVFVTPLLLIVLQPALLSKIWKRSQNQVNYSEPDHQRVTKAYFESLTTMWK
ncbi:unnamed protein product [Nippostrongylus brasiliensis]|uniref:RSN1_7TM domain-containing protein n=1 Tax=Nippostrongylus brasiliensis TaxID=27835 RepID=A0A158QXW1_NIPBR|nr:unnamed protein product [Nippostrongylus brasiliensis]